MLEGGDRKVHVGKTPGLCPTCVGAEAAAALVLATPLRGGAARWQVARPVVSEMGVPPRSPQGAVEPSAMVASERKDPVSWLAGGQRPTPLGLRQALMMTLCGPRVC